MKNWYIRLLLLIAYVVPYAFLAVWGDAVFGAMLLYVVMFAAFLILYTLCIRTGKVVVLLTGNILSFVCSIVAAKFTHLEELSWYFKPFTALSLLTVLSAAAWVMQILVLLYCKRKKG